MDTHTHTHTHTHEHTYQLFGQKKQGGHLSYSATDYITDSFMQIKDVTYKINLDYVVTYCHNIFAPLE